MDAMDAKGERSMKFHNVRNYFLKVLRFAKGV